MRGFTAGGTSEYRNDTSRSRDGEEMEGGLQVGNHDSADKQGGHSEMREAHGKGFVPSLLRGDPQHSPEDLHIRQHNRNKTSKSKNGTKVRSPASMRQK